ncbi:hypothetical protein GYMLUDRAFT_251901 [Collybiopsis luxurians FD-317 M1]|uniref:BTB domain-containing protein n=1 Tax=Collybiopsis luxurians FD-317 M1 TaxID=944289 RepID=A0A0D0BPS2_9AGAR|nr:hypothetical protein GYMLUDRAFT_251901 [Collybiopsis luxurians FD-317 M1]
MTISSMTSSTNALSATQKECEGIKDLFRALKVESVVFRVNATLLCKASATFKKMFLRNADSTKPIVLRGLKAQKFSNLLWSLSTSSLPQLLDEKSLERLLDVEELAQRFAISQLHIRAESTLLATIAQGKNPAIISCSSRSLSRMVKIVLRVGNQPLFSFLMQMWTWRLHSRELHHVHAMRLAQPSRWAHDPRPFLKLLGHAFYAAMMDVEPKLASGQCININSTLTQPETIHIRCGYHSLRSWWDQIASQPPLYEHSPRCDHPERCSSAWRVRFESIADMESLPFPKVDGIRRIQELHKCLKDDLFLTQSMPVTCRHNALQELQKRRENLLETLHHHFDL